MCVVLEVRRVTSDLQPALEIATRSKSDALSCDRLEIGAGATFDRVMESTYLSAPGTPTSPYRCVIGSLTMINCKDCVLVFV